MLSSVFSWLFIAACTFGFAHPGRTASDGCHYCRTNCAKWGEVSNARHCHRKPPSVTVDKNAKQERKVAQEERAAQREAARQTKANANASRKLAHEQRRARAAAKKSTLQYSGVLHETKAHVENVIDGDTLLLKVESQTITVRVQGITCPEPPRPQACEGDGAKTCTVALLQGIAARQRVVELVGDKQVTLEATKGEKMLEREAAGPVIAHVQLNDGKDLGEVLTAERLCQKSLAKNPRFGAASYQNAVKLAR